MGSAVIASCSGSACTAVAGAGAESADSCGASIRASASPALLHGGEQAAQNVHFVGIELGALVVKILSLPGAERTVAITFVMAEEDVETNLRHPRVMVGSDGLPNPEGRPHPRLYGTFPRVLGEYGRKRGLFSLQFAVAKMTSLPCERFGLASRGRVAEGFFADLLLFDPELIVDRATFADPKQAPLGIELVLVNGVVASVGGSSTDERAGRFLRFNK